MNKPDIRFNGFNGEWEEKKINEISEINPHSELPVQFEYVDLESVTGTEMVSHRTERLESAPSRAQRLAQKGDIFYQTVRPYQKNNYYFNLDEKDYVFSTGYAQLRSKLDGNFFLSVLQSDKFVADVLENCTGTSYPAINPTTLGNLKVAFPDNAEQKKLGALFSQIDSLIASTQKELDKLVSLKKCMLQKMFPKKGCLVPEIRFKGFSGNWEEKKISDLATIFIGLVTTMTKYYSNQGTLLIRNSDIKDNYFSFSDNPIYLNQEFADQNSSRKHKIGDVITVHTGDVGTSAVITEKEEGTIGFATIVTRPKTNLLDSMFLSIFLNSDAHKIWAVSVSTGDGRTNYNLGDYTQLLLKIPSLPEQQKIGSYFQNLDNLISKQSAELEKLKNVKKTLLSKMFV